MTPGGEQRTGCSITNPTTPIQPIKMIFEEPVKATISNLMNNFAYNDAIFMAERFHSEVGTEDTLLLLATCHFRANKVSAACSMLVRAEPKIKSPSSKLLLARCCFEMKKFNEAEDALLSPFPIPSQAKGPAPTVSGEDLLKFYGELTPFVAQILAQIAVKAERNSRAAEYNRITLKLNPFLYSSYESLVQTGEDVDPDQVFDVDNLDFKMCHGSNPLINLWNQFSTPNENVNPLNVSTITSSGTTPYSTTNFSQTNTSSINVYHQPGVGTSIFDNSLNLTVSPKDPTNTSTSTNGGVSVDLTSSPYAVIKSVAGSGLEIFTPNMGEWVCTTANPSDAPIKKIKPKVATRFAPGQAPLIYPMRDVFQEAENINLPQAETPIGWGRPFGTSSSYIEMTQMLGDNSHATPVNVVPINNGSPIPVLDSHSQLAKVQSENNVPKVSSPRNSASPPKRTMPRRSQPPPPTTRPTIARSSSIFPSNANTNNQINSGAVRRSTRLFNSNSHSSLKENSTIKQNDENKTKAPVIKAPRKKQKVQTGTNTLNKEKDAEETKFITLCAEGIATEPLFTKEDVEEMPLVETSINQSVLNEELIQTGMKMQKSSTEWLMHLLRDFGRSQLALGTFELLTAIKVLSSLPSKHRNSGWVLTTMGRCYFELNNYTEAIKYFERARVQEPHRLQGTEYYSTCLWHLQKEVRLSSLSLELIEQDKTAPQTWIVAGNCFSLQKEHETATKFLQRAIQVDPDFAYAYTLLGHELIQTEEMEHAMACFRSAIRIDPRHYNAWYGMGAIMFKQEKYSRAEIHYRRALQICASSPVLRCHVALVLNAQKKTQEGLELLEDAIRIDSKNAISRFHRASFLCTLERYEEALEELETIKDLIPKESLVYFLIGRVSWLFYYFYKNVLTFLFLHFITQIHRRLGNNHLALMNFSWATDLDPKGANHQMKEVLDRQYPSDEQNAVIDLSESGSESLGHEASLHESMEAEDDSNPNDIMPFEI